MMFGLFLGTIGLIGFGIGYEQLWPDLEYKISDNQRLEITSLSNAFDPGGIKVYIYYKFPYLPLQQKIVSRTFDDFYIDLSSVKYSYNKERQEVEIWTEGTELNKCLYEVIKINGK
jgi:hypothetical protein